MFATLLEIRTKVGVSFWLSVPSPSFPNTFPLILFVYSYIPFPSSGGRWALCHYSCSQKKKLLLCIYSSRLYESNAPVSVQNTRHLHSGLDSDVPRSAEQDAMPCCGRFHVWSTIKRRQRLTSGPRIQVQRGSGVDGNVVRTRKGLNIVFHTWNLTSRVLQWPRNAWHLKPADWHPYVSVRNSKQAWLDPFENSETSSLHLSLSLSLSNLK
jgi:hypothetical protein